MNTKQYKLDRILDLGAMLEYIIRSPKIMPNVKGENFLYENIKRVEKSLISLGLNGSLKYQVQLMKEKLESYEEIKIIVPGDARFIQNKATTLLELIRYNLDEILTFEVIKECILDKPNLIKLMNSQNSIYFEEDIWNQLSEIGKSDFSDAAKCLLIGAPTPATMITMRGAEEILRLYYTHKTRNDPGKKTWGNLTDELKKVPGINEDLIGHLDYLRKTHRNVAQHPNKIFNQREAERVFMEINSMVHSIYSDMNT